MKFNKIRNAETRFLRFRRSLLNGSLTVFVILVTAMFAASCGGGAAERAENVGGVTARQIIENPTAYIGKTVTVSGDVEEIHGPRAFNMDSGLSVGELLVVGREPFPQVPDRGSNTAYVVSDVATVTGVVRMLVAADIEREIGWDLEPNLEAQFNAKPVLIAQSISFRPGANRTAASGNNSPAQMANNANQTAPANGNTNQTAAGDEVTDYLVIVAAPDRQTLVGKRVRLTDVKVQSVVGDRTFYIGPSESQKVLVVLEEEKTPNTPVEGKVNINPGQTVSFTGAVEKVPSVEEARQRFGNLMSETELNKLKDERVFIRADSVNIKGK